MSLTADAVVAVLERRYDFYSARTVFRAICAHAGVSADGPFDNKAAGALADALLAVGDRVDAVAGALREAAPAGKAPVKPKATPKAAPKTEATAAPAKKPAPKAKKAQPQQPPQGDAPKG